MRVYLGEKGLKESWQDPFPKTTKCHKCKKRAKIMFVGIEEEYQIRYICDLHKTTGKRGRLWLHDVMACAVYLCPFCFNATALINQA